MSEPIVIRVLRPYADEASYLAAEAWSLSTKGMLLIDQPELPPETVVRFDVALESGEKVVRAEAKVVRHVAPGNGRPGGLQVKFKRFGAATKEFLDRAASARPASIAPRPRAPSSVRAPKVSDATAPDVAPARLSTPSIVIDDSTPSLGPPHTVRSAADQAPAYYRGSSPEIEIAVESAPDAASEPEPDVAAAPPEPSAPGFDAAPSFDAAPAVAPTSSERVEQSGVRHRVVPPVAPPKNREELLAKLRARHGARGEGQRTSGTG